MSQTWLGRDPCWRPPSPLFPSQGKSFVKDALRCMALGLRQRFSCVSRRCAAVREMVYSLQRECYSKHRLCLALQDHMDTMGSLIQFHLMFPPGWGRHISQHLARFSAFSERCSRLSITYGLQTVLLFTVNHFTWLCMCVPSRPYVELMNFLLKCGEEVRLWVGWRLRRQCEQHWGMLCSSFGGGCPLNQPDTLQNTTMVPSLAPWPLTVPGPQPHTIDNGTEPGFQGSEKVNISMS